MSIGISRFGRRRERGQEAAAARWDPLDFATDRVQAMTAVLARFGYRCETPPDLAALTAERLADGIWTAAANLGPDGVLVVHLLTHGHVSETGALYAVGADGQHHSLSDVGHWLRRIVDTPGSPRTLFLLDLCHAGAATRMSWQMSVAGGDSRAWVIAACAPTRGAFSGRFSEAVVNVLRAFADSRIDIDPMLPFIPLATVAREIRREVQRLTDERGAYAQEVTATVVDISAEPTELPFFRNPRHYTDPRVQARPRVDTALAPFLDDLDDTLDPAHFVERAAGHEGRLDLGCFQGRRRELRLLSAWFDGHDDVRTRVITGSPGVGKSALLGVLVCAAHPVLRRPTQPIWEHVDKYPAPNPRLVAVHARQRSLPDLVRSLARQLSLTVGDDHATDDLLAGIAGSPEPPVVVLDALDEAVDQVQVMSRLLLPLARLDRPDGRPACRLLVATRRWERFGPLLALASPGLVDLDDVPTETVRYDVESYVSDLLRRHKPYDTVDYSGARQTFAAAVATALTSPDERSRRREWGEFLVAGLYAHHLVTGYAPIREAVDAAELGWRVPMTLPDLLELDLTVRAGVRWLRPVLAAVAHARGDGMPARTIGHAARAFLGVSNPEEAPPEEIAAALRTARFYLRRVTDVDGTTLYRLFHQSLADHLRSHPVQRTETGAADPQLLLAALLAPLSGTDGHRWDIAEPYLLRHAVQHAVDAGQDTLLLDEVEFLVHADPAAVAPLLAGHPWLTADDLLEAAAAGPTPLQRRQLLALCAVRHGAHDAAWRLANPPGQAPAPWQPVWSFGSAATALACAEGADVIAVGDRAGNVHLLDRDRGTPLAPVHLEASPVVALAFGYHTGRLVLLACAGSSMWLLDGTTGAVLHTTVTGPFPFGSVSLTSVAGRLFAVLAGPLGIVELLDVFSGEDSLLRTDLPLFPAVAPLGDRFEQVSLGGDDNPLCFTVGDRLLAATAEDSAVVVWDVEEQRRIDVVPVTGRVGALAVTDWGDIAVLAAGQVLLLAHRSQDDEPDPVAEPVVPPEPPVPPEEPAVGRARVPDPPPAEEPAPDEDQPRSAAPHDGFQDIMDEFFGAAASRGPRPRTRPGADAILRLDLDLQETAFGVEAPITVDTAVVCATCTGNGTAPGTHPVTCDVCDGRGEIQSVQRTFLGQVNNSRPCSACQGFGIVIPHPCKLCAGDGRLRTRRSLTVKIPAGVEDGMRVRLARQGEVGPGGGPAGDLYVEIHERPHDVYSRKGDDLHCRITVPMTVAALGTRFTIKTLDGEETVDVERGTQPGSTLRIAGKGVPHLRERGRGDLFVHLDIRTPANLSTAERRTLTQFVGVRAEQATIVPSSYSEHEQDVHLQAAVPMALAALGTSVEVRTPTKGDVQVSISAGTQPNAKTRLRGHGSLGATGKAGDVMVQFDVQVPTDLSLEAERVLRRFAELRNETTVPGSEPSGFFSRVRDAFNGR
ncbi:hypothetical protein GCM10010532_080580 [Dactylosporangium siamense]